MPSSKFFVILCLECDADAQLECPSLDRDLLPQEMMA